MTEDLTTRPVFGFGFGFWFRFVELTHQNVPGLRILPSRANTDLETTRIVGGRVFGLVEDVVRATTVP